MRLTVVRSPSFLTHVQGPGRFLKSRLFVPSQNDIWTYAFGASGWNVLGFKGWRVLRVVLVLFEGRGAPDDFTACMCAGCRLLQAGVSAPP